MCSLRVLAINGHMVALTRMCILRAPSGTLWARSNTVLACKHHTISHAGQYGTGAGPCIIGPTRHTDPERTCMGSRAGPTQLSYGLLQVQHRRKPVPEIFSHGLYGTCTGPNIIEINCAGSQPGHPRSLV